MFIVVFEKFSKTYHMVEVKESEMTDEARRYAFSLVREKLEGQKTWLTVKEVIVPTGGTGNCFEGDLTGRCFSCEYWEDGTHGNGLGCAAPFPISHCPAMTAFQDADKARRKYEFIISNCNRCKKRFSCEHLRSGEYWWCDGVDGDIPDGNDDYFHYVED